jgi:hypothetical protein
MSRRVLCMYLLRYSESWRLCNYSRHQQFAQELLRVSSDNPTEDPWLGGVGHPGLPQEHAYRHAPRHGHSMALVPWILDGCSNNDSW